VGEIVRSALEQNELVNCAKLFNNYYVQSTFEKSVKGKSKTSLENLTVPNTQTEQKIEKIWNDDSKALNIDHVMSFNKMDLNLDQNISKVIDHLAEKLFSKGIQLEVNVDEKMTVVGSEEALEQILFHALQFAISSTNTNNSTRKIGVNAIKLGDLIALDINNSGAGFSAEVLKAKVGLETTSSVIDLDLQICQSLVSEIGGKMQFDNRIDQSGATTGARIKLILKAGENRTAKLVDLKKGSKKELMAQLGTF
jgi:K+-sensing histidine kinase KdpD